MYTFDILVVDDNDHCSISDDTINFQLLGVKNLVAQHGQKPKRTNAPSASDKEMNQLVKDIQAAGISAKRALKSKCANLDALDDKNGLLEIKQTIRRHLTQPNHRQQKYPAE